MVKHIHATNFNTLCDLSFDIKETDKPTQAFRSVIIQINVLLCKIDSRSRFIKYFNVVATSETKVTYLKDLIDMSDPLRFLKALKEFFLQLKSKGKWSCQCVKFHLLHDAEIDDVTETLKEEFNEIKFCMKQQAVQSNAVIGATLLMCFCPDVHLKSLE